MVLYLSDRVELKNCTELRELILNYLSSNQGGGFTLKFLFTTLVLEQWQYKISESEFESLLNEMKDAEGLYRHRIFHKSSLLYFYSIDSLSFHIRKFHSLPEEQKPKKMREIFKTRDVKASESDKTEGHSFEMRNAILAFAFLIILLLLTLLIQIGFNI